MNSAKKRTKRYNPNRIQARIPITRPLLDTFAQDLHFSLMCAQLGHFGKDQFDKIGGSLNLIWAALYKRTPKDPSMVAVIEGAMRAMNECGARGDKTGVWTLTMPEQAAVRAGAAKAEEALAFLDVMALYNARRTCEELREEERKAA